MSYYRRTLKKNGDEVYLAKILVKRTPRMLLNKGAHNINIIKIIEQFRFSQSFHYFDLTLSSASCVKNLLNSLFKVVPSLNFPGGCQFFESGSESRISSGVGSRVEDGPKESHCDSTKMSARLRLRSTGISVNPIARRSSSTRFFCFLFEEAVEVAAALN